MIDLLRAKRELLEEQKEEAKIVYEDIEQKVEEYRKELYNAKYAEVEKKNMLIDAQIEVIDEVIEEAKKVVEAMEAEADASVGAGEYEQREAGY